MKKLYLLAASAAVCMASYATPVSLQMLHEGWKNAEVSGKSLKMKSVPTWNLSQTRSVDNPQTEFTATAAEFYYMGDVLGNGTGVYQLYLSNTAMDKGMPTEEGQMARLELIGSPCDADNPELCTGTFEVVNDLSEETLIEGVLVGADSDVLDCFPHPEDPSAGLVAYSFEPVSGSLVIEKEGDEYSISFSFTGENRDSETGEVYMSQECSATYKGACEYVDIYAYTPFERDVQLPKFNASGRYTDGGAGDYSIAFYTDGMLDEDGFIVSSGYLLNVELFVEDVTPMDLNNLVATFTPRNVMEEGPKPGTFGEGVWYEMYGMYFPLLTTLSEYNSYGEITRVALCVDGTITGSKTDNGFRLDFDLISAEGHKVTGAYEGDLEAAISDFSSNSGVKTLGGSAINQVYGGKGCVVAPQGAEIYTMSGLRTSDSNLTPGIYLVRSEGRTFKVQVK